jgi:hypothetical protein
MSLSNPFRYKDWFNTHGEGATDTGDDVEVGRENIPDDRDSTIILANTPENAALMGIFAGVVLEDDDRDSGQPNSPPDAPGIGVYGEGKNARGIGVAGACDSGTGLYGVSTLSGFGVVGRSLAGSEVETEAIGSVVQEDAVGVVGHSNRGTGVRGHGGSLTPPETDPPPQPPPAVRGGTFSAGWQSEQVIAGISAPQRLGLNSIPQMRIVPSTNQALPAEAKLGDVYLVTRIGPQWSPRTGAAFVEVWVCTAIVGNQAFWQQVQLASNFVPGGSPLPPPT